MFQRPAPSRCHSFPLQEDGIKVENLTKRYANYTAIKDLSFEVERGEIVGFLGPNGAGKSTTMRILSCFQPATSGRATVAGYDVFSQSLQVREHLGYLPENVPLYTDMRVNEYLEHRAALKGLSGKKLRTRVGEVKEMTDLNDVQRKLVGNLSKGYRQRVGLAEALVGDPDLLILDEPTIGLDPNQIRQVRDLIKNLGKKHTILLSTHILPEVEMTCSRVIILHKGKIEASDTPQNLLNHLRAVGNIRLEARHRHGQRHRGKNSKRCRASRKWSWKLPRRSAPPPKPPPPMATSARVKPTAATAPVTARSSSKPKPGRTRVRNSFASPWTAVGPCANSPAAAPRSKTYSWKSPTRK